jgi:hypothetical protein
MSILNTLANMLTPEYPAMFMIRTPAMADAERENKGVFKGAIPVELHNAESLEVIATKGLALSRVPNSIVHPSLLLSLVPLAVVGGLSGFQEGNSSQLERGFTMSWLVVGIFWGVAAGIETHVGAPGGITGMAETSKAAVTQMSLTRRSVKAMGRFVFAFTSLLVTLLFLRVPTVGGMVVVGRMIRDFGICTGVD